MAVHEFDFTISQVNKAGDRIRKAARNGDPFRAEDLDLLNRFRAWHQPTLETCQRELVTWFHKQLELDAELVFIAGRPLKTVEAIVAKLVRSGTRLSRMQDIAGTRIVVPNLTIQEAAAELVEFKFSGQQPEIARDSREHGDDFGYRALHMVVTLDGRLAEIQIRTKNQDLWAQVVENTDQAIGSDLKHGKGPTEWLEWLIDLSDSLRQRDLGNPVALPPSPYDRQLQGDSEGE